jgi:hypothetical protein
MDSLLTRRLPDLTDDVVEKFRLPCCMPCVDQEENRVRVRAGIRGIIIACTPLTF